MKKKDIKNNRYGRLLVLEESKHQKKRGVLWDCMCFCGNFISVSASSLISGNTRSCGCLNTEAKHRKNFMDRESYLWSKLYRRNKSKAKTRGLCWSIDFENFKYLSEQRCFYCGCKPSNKFKDKCSGNIISDTVIEYSGLDRVDSSDGYTYANVVPCCADCNQMKMDFNLIYFLEKIRNIYNNYYGGQDTKDPNRPKHPKPNIKPVPTHRFKGE